MDVREALDRVWSDNDLKRRLIANPKPVLKEFGIEIGDPVSVVVHENTYTTVHFVLPKQPAGSVEVQTDDPVQSVIGAAWKDPAFKRNLLNNPK